MATPEAEEFAALLKELKNRSGHSYGVLAGRLHVSTSTLHRYCNGDAVPNEYAPVERLGRLCGASPDELVELHRRWIVADAARRRPVAVPDSVPVPAPAPVSDSESVPEPGAVAEAVASPEDRDGGEDKDGDALAPEVVTAGASRPRRFWSFPRARVLLAAVAVVALTVPTTIIVSNLSGTDRGGLSDAPAVDGVPALPDDESAPASPGTPDPSDKPAKPGKSGAATAPSLGSGAASASASTGHSAGAGAGPGAQTGGGVPLNATISSYNWDAPCGQYYVLDQKPNEVPPPPAPQDTRGWARALGGVDGGSLLLELTVQGKSDQAVVLQGLHVRTLSRKEPLAWSAYSMGEGCGSGITPQSFDIDLDDSRPTLTPVAGRQGDKRVPPKDFPFRVSSTDVEVFDLNAHVDGHDVSWYLELEWSSGGREGTLRIDDGGKPFRTSSIKTRPQYLYRHDTAQWVTKE
ncbi:helix-turn-helix domain-containing protein [Streptomyces sp. NBC_00873]|uniref:helix-turn-helix domain-containing protein n=1 Tax=unclassified Streptomyces TaxID=2593676 RepID=UPI003867CB84|nr:helix-turn-helix domain-containing protein [Streptomyces sp. NBC_00873]WTA44497.1 helix-turn-helix domain-containing protein [Streptomyces sp. NBC_00842]